MACPASDSTLLTPSTRYGMRAEEALAVDGAPIPFWAFAWAGGLRACRAGSSEHPDEVADRSVLDFATGSGSVGIVAARLGATVRRSTSTRSQRPPST